MTLDETRVVLLRHAETSDPDRFHGAESDVGLGARGFRQAEAVARILSALSPAVVVSSAMRRALETARPIAEACGVPLRIEPDLHERKMGPLSGTARAEGREAYELAKGRWVAGDLDHTHEGGESFAAIRERVVPVFNRVAREWAGTTVVVVAHGVVIRVVLSTLLEDKRPADFGGIAIANVALNDLRFDGARWTAVSLNQSVVRLEGEDSYEW